jgi:hypothetical protein
MVFIAISASVLVLKMPLSTIVVVVVERIGQLPSNH